MRVIPEACWNGKPLVCCAARAASKAAQVRGPSTPSIGPGQKPNAAQRACRARTAFITAVMAFSKEKAPLDGGAGLRAVEMMGG